MTDSRPGGPRSPGQFCRRRRLQYAHASCTRQDALLQQHFPQAQRVTHDGVLPPGLQQLPCDEPFESEADDDDESVQRALLQSMSDASSAAASDLAAAILASQSLNDAAAAANAAADADLAAAIAASLG